MQSRGLKIVVACLLQTLLALRYIETSSVGRTLTLDRSGWRTVERAQVTGRDGKLIEWDDEEPGDLIDGQDLSYIITSSQEPTEPPLEGLRQNRSESAETQNLNLEKKLGDSWKAVEYVADVEDTRVNSKTRIDAPIELITAVDQQAWWNRLKPQATANKKQDRNSTLAEKVGLDHSWMPLGQEVTSSEPELKKQNFKLDWKSDIQELEKNPIRLDFKWQPVKSQSQPQLQVKDRVAKESNLTRVAPREIHDDGIIYGHRTLNSPRYLIDWTSGIHEPFDDDGIIVAREAKSAQFSNEPRLSSNQTNELSQAKRESESRWIPMDFSGSLTANSSDLTQKSASDLNYIYSSQPVSVQSDSIVARPTMGAGYGQYQQVAPTSQPAADQPSITILDQNSGQVPEMISLDRVPDVPQPSTIPEMPYSYSYGSNPQPQVDQPTRQLSLTSAPVSRSSPQVIRQEHHHHYYEQPPLQRQATPSPSFRELPPLVISQPIIQQTPAPSPTSTTPAPPQIIREIYREVPAAQPVPAPVQVTRVVAIPAPPPIPIPPVVVPSLPTPVVTSPARQIIRQISGGIPSVSMRLPHISQMAQIKLALPMRLATTSSQPTNTAPVTRQTGSFVIPPMPKKTTTYLTQTQAVPTHTTIMHTTQYTPATRTTVYTTEHQTEPQLHSASSSYRR